MALRINLAASAVSVRAVRSQAIIRASLLPALRKRLLQAWPIADNYTDLTCQSFGSENLGILTRVTTYSCTYAIALWRFVRGEYLIMRAAGSNACAAGSRYHLISSFRTEMRPPHSLLVSFVRRFLIAVSSCFPDSISVVVNVHPTDRNHQGLKPLGRHTLVVLLNSTS